MQRAPGWVGRRDRDAVSLGGTALLSDGRQIPVSLGNLSAEGCQLRADETIALGELIQIDVPPLEGVLGTVRWSLFGNAGVRFIRLRM